MKILFMGENGISLACISIAIYDEDDKQLWFSIDDTTITKSEVIIENVTSQMAENILRELYDTGKYDFSNLGLHVQVC